MTTLLDRICRSAELLAEFRARPEQTLRALGASMDETEFLEMRPLEDDAVIDVAFVNAA